MERLGDFAQVPSPFTILPAGTQPLRTLDALSIIEQLLEDTTALAGTLYSASLNEENTEREDISGALRVLNEELRATLSIFRRWQDDNDIGCGGKEGVA